MVCRAVLLNCGTTTVKTVVGPAHSLIGMPGTLGPGKKDQVRFAEVMRKLVESAYRASLIVLVHLEGWILRFTGCCTMTNEQIIECSGS